MRLGMFIINFVMELIEDAHSKGATPVVEAKREGKEINVFCFSNTDK